MSNEEFEEHYLPLLRSRLKRWTLRREVTDDCIAIGWYLWRRNPNWHVNAIAKWAYRSYWRGYGIPTGQRRANQGRVGPGRGEPGLAGCGRSYTRPDRAAMLREEVRRALSACQTQREQKMLKMYAYGHTRIEIATGCGVSVVCVRETMLRLRSRLS